MLCCTLTACGGGGDGGDAGDLAGIYDVVIKSDVPKPWDPGTPGDPGSPQDPGKPADPGNQDPGNQDPGTSDPGFGDTGTPDTSLDAPVDPGTDPGEETGTDPGAGSDSLQDHGPITDDTTTLDTTIPDEGTAPGDDGSANDLGTGADDGTSDVPPVDTTCQEFYTCASLCAGVATCVNACFVQMTPEGQTEQLALENCLDANGCFGLPDDQFSDCLDANCLDPYMACFSGGTLLTCVELNQCLGACPDNDSDCTTDCFNGATYEANWAHQHLHDCLVDTCGEVPPDSDPVGYAAWNACAAPAMFVECGDLGNECVASGDLYPTCADLIDCLVGCPEDDPLTPDVDEDQVCVNACFDGASFQANADYEVRRKCLLGQCPVCEIENPTPAQDQECVDCLNVAANGPCKGEAKACQASGANPCGAILACVLQCPTSECVQDCYGTGTWDAQDLYDALLDCAQTVCPDLLVTCVETTFGNECFTEHAACQNDG